MLRGANMLRGRGPGGLLIAGLAAFAYYKYSKMSPEQKRDLVGNLKAKGKKFLDQFMPSSKANPNTEGSQYNG